MNARMLLFVSIALATALACLAPASPGETTIAWMGPDHKAPGLLVATRTPTRRPPKTPTRRPTRTPLPPLPDFEQVISFSTGAGCGLCCEYEYNVPSPNYLSASVGNHLAQLTACFWLWGFDPNQPFQVVVERLDAPGNVRLQSSDLFVDLREAFTMADGRKNVKIGAQDYPGGDYFGELYVGTDGIVSGKFNMWSPVRFSPGKWRMSIVQQSSSFGTFGSEFIVEARGRYPDILTQSSRSRSLLQPMSGDFNPYHLIAPRTGKIDVSGINFRAGKPVYLLVYHQTGADEMELISKQVVQSNSSGSVIARLSGPFQPGDSYLLLALSDPNTPLRGNNIAASSLPYDSFQIEGAASSPSASTSCPGAPPQRMIVNRRGYVCTKGDSVRLRSAASRSASSIVSLQANSQFTVIGGPSCADNWSWWQIQTDSGYSGWISEGGDAVDPYFICPLP